MSTAVAISGATGRMGRTLQRIIANSPDFHVIGGIAAERHLPAGPSPDGSPPLVAPEEAGPILMDAEAIVDFSAGSQLLQLLDQFGECVAGRALVVGTTALTDEVLLALRRASQCAPLVQSANFSPGINLLLALVERAAALLESDDFDAEIVEAHHGMKVDAPSGTAIALGEAISAGRQVDLTKVRRDGRSGLTGERPDGQIGFHSIRGGDLAGEHRVMFLGEAERLEMAHQTSDRRVFAHGALLAVKWAVSREPGWYSMRDVLGL